MFTYDLDNFDKNLPSVKISLILFHDGVEGAAELLLVQNPCIATARINCSW